MSGDTTLKNSKKAALIGYMGSGKTTVGKILSHEMSLPFYDLDQLISQKEGKSIQNIFDERGELGFRKSEKETLSNFLHESQEFILSVGGGTTCYYDNIQLLNQHCHTIYLDTAVDQLLSRLSSDAAKRPLLQTIDAERLPEFIAKHLFERRPFYQRAQFKISTDGLSPGQVASRIYSLLR